MKYLIQNRKEFTITLVALIVAILDCLKVLGLDVPDVNEEYLLAVISAIMGALVWFYNMPTSKENCEHTGQMRLEKMMRKIAQKQGQFIGEDFYNELEEEEEVEEK